MSLCFKKSCDDRYNENLTTKYNFAVGEVSFNYFVLVTLQEMGEMSFHLIRTNDFHVKAESKRFQGTAIGLLLSKHLRQNKNRLLFA